MKLLKAFFSSRRMRVMQKKANAIRKKIAESLNVVQKRQVLIQNSEWCKWCNLL
jgi:hypothetical protein